MMLGLARTDAATASLLLTLEGATALIAWFVFHENLDRRIALGMLCVVAGAVLVSWSGAPTFEGMIGPLAILGACVAWGLDNNLTRKVSLADPLQIVELKGLVAGPVNLALGLWAGGSFPAPSAIILAMTVGFLGYGVSLALFIVSLRDLGAARTGAYFSTAPFLGAVAAVIALGEPVSLWLLAAGALMVLGVSSGCRRSCNGSASNISGSGTNSVTPTGRGAALATNNRVSAGSSVTSRDSSDLDIFEIISFSSFQTAHTISGHHPTEQSGHT
jgi:drug/metabolite transporter (DMT)-like permease